LKTSVFSGVTSCLRNIAAICAQVPLVERKI